jgi:hypothetical protein
MLAGLAGMPCINRHLRAGMEIPEGECVVVFGPTCSHVVFPAGSGSPICRSVLLHNSRPPESRTSSSVAVLTCARGTQYQASLRISTFSVLE